MSNWLRDAATDVNSRRSLAGRARARRWRHFNKSFPSLSHMRVLDLGGTPESWRLAPVRPKSVVTVNLVRAESDSPDITAVQGDACDLPSSIAKERFDLVFSNSLLEHVGGHVQRQRLADNIHALADRHWVQTPYRYFPIEPHWLFPGIQWLPYEARVRVSLRWNRGHIRTYTREEAQAQVDEIDLIGIAQMRRYFPSSVMWYERFAGLVKSLVAIKNAEVAPSEPA
jgi:Methyltransferase domain